jgi:hypothetical protein
MNVQLFRNITPPHQSLVISIYFIDDNTYGKDGNDSAQTHNIFLINMI